MASVTTSSEFAPCETDGSGWLDRLPFVPRHGISAIGIGTDGVTPKMQHERGELRS